MKILSCDRQVVTKKNGMMMFGLPKDESLEWRNTMHVVTGGAYHGKSAWVKDFYNLDHGSSWMSAYDKHPFPRKITSSSPIVVLEGVEEWIRQAILSETMNDRYDAQSFIENWLSWERETDKRRLIIIGTDISKGIVPVEREQRAWRDLTGWFFQELVLYCKRFDVIWYGIPKRLK